MDVTSAIIFIHHSHRYGHYLDPYLPHDLEHRSPSSLSVFVIDTFITISTFIISIHLTVFIIFILMLLIPLFVVIFLVSAFNTTATLLVSLPQPGLLLPCGFWPLCLFCFSWLLNSLWTVYFLLLPCFVGLIWCCGFIFQP